MDARPTFPVDNSPPVSGEAAPTGTPTGTDIPFPEPPALSWDRQKLQRWHHELLERMFLRPLDSLKDHAAALDKHEVTVSQVARSDLFLSKLEEMQGYRDRLLVHQIDVKMDQVIDEGLNRVHEAVSDFDCGPEFALKAVESLDKRRRGEKKNGSGEAPTVSVGINIGDLEEARKLIQVHARSEGTESGNSSELLNALKSGN